MRRSAVALVLAVVALAGCAERTPLPAPTLGPVVDDKPEAGPEAPTWRRGRAGAENVVRSVLSMVRVSRTAGRRSARSAMFNVPILDHCEDANMADHGVMHEGDVYSLSLTRAGRYEYICGLHPSMMAVLIVTD